jgi:lysophospholipase L1-like esterase
VKLKRFSIIFILMLALNTVFSSFVFADGDNSSSLVALGDSITYGYHLEPNQTAPSPNAFPNLIGTKGAYRVTNLGVPGITSTDLLNSIIHPVGNARTALENADVFTLYIGGNDLLQAAGFSSATLQSLATLPPDQKQIFLEKFKTDATAAAAVAGQTLNANLNGIIKEIRDQNVVAPIILYNLYNPIGDSQDPAIHSLHTLGDTLISSINSQVIAPLVAQKENVYLADAFSAFNGNQATFMLPGDVHPNLEGHKALARLADKILSTLVPEDEELYVKLTASPTEDTKGPVNITVETNGDDVQVMKWLPGVKSKVDFKSDGNVITNSTFQVTENGIYTVYVLDDKECSEEAVGTIEIKNIKDPVVNNPTPTPTPTPTNSTTPTPTPITVTGNALPDTATPMYNYLAIGLGLVLAGFAAMKVQQFRRKENI